MRAILMSIRPQHTCNILNGIKLWEIRKKFPSDFVGWVYIYCTKDKKYANLINNRYGYNVSRVGNKKEDFEKSNIEYDEPQNYNYKIICKGCNQEFYRQRLNRNFLRYYRCAKCGSKFEVYIRYNK